MSGALFTPKKIGPIVVPNRFMRSATWEALGDPIGSPTSRQRTIMESLAEGGVGLIVTAAMVVTPKCSLVGKANGMFTGDHSRAWAPIIKNIHSHGSKIAIQLVHGARFSNPAFNGGFPAIPVSSLKEGEPEMTNADIEEIIEQFLDSAYLSARAGADGVQLHCAHASTFMEFLSPHFNRRTDKWGGSPENRVRIVKEIAEQIRRKHPELMLSVKLNGSDCIEGGVTPEIAAKHVQLLSGSIDLVEVSCGTNMLGFMHCQLDDDVLVRGVKKSERDGLLRRAHEMYDGHPFHELYNLDAVTKIRAENPNALLAIVGGCRERSSMEHVIESGVADLVSLSRPFLRDPYLVNRFRTGEISRVNCTSCGACLLACEKGVYCHQPA